jgi:excisionase family DNA binding protein
MRPTTEASQLVPLLTSKQLAGILHVPLNTVYVWQTRGTGPPAIRVGRHTRYREADVEAWLLERQAASP